MIEDMGASLESGMYNEFGKVSKCSDVPIYPEDSGKLCHFYLDGDIAEMCGYEKFGLNDCIGVIRILVPNAELGIPTNRLRFIDICTGKRGEIDLDANTFTEYSEDTPSITVDTELDTNSENPVQNKVITKKIDELEASIPEVDTYIDSESENPVQNKVIYSEVESMYEDINSKLDMGWFNPISTIDENTKLEFLTYQGNNPMLPPNLKVPLSAIKTPVDTELDSNSENPVQNKVIAESIDNINSQLDGLDALLAGI